MLARILSILSISMLFPALCFATIYKWVDEEGKIHYSERKPPEASAEKMNVPSKAPTVTSTYKRPSLKTEDETGADTQGDTQQKKPEMNPEEKKKACNDARKSLETINSRGRVKLRDKDGNIRYMGEDERQDRIKREQERINKYCN